MAYAEVVRDAEGRYFWLHLPGSSDDPGEPLARHGPFDSWTAAYESAGEAPLTRAFRVDDRLQAGPPSEWGKA